MISFKNARQIAKGHLCHLSQFKEFEVRDLFYYHFARTAFLFTLVDYIGPSNKASKSVHGTQSDFYKELSASTICLN